MSSKESERWKLRVLDIRDQAAYIREFTEGLSYDDFKDDMKTVFAVMRCFQVIGEAAKKVPDHVREQYPAVPWRKMTGFRDKIVHDYDEIDLPFLWRTAQDQLPEAEKEILKIPVSEEDLE